MKLVVKHLPETLPTILVNETDSSNFYGVIVNGAQGFVRSDRYSQVNRKFGVYAFSGFTRSNEWERFAKNTYTLSEYLNWLIDQPGIGKIVEFDTFLELATWASHNES